MSWRALGDLAILPLPDGEGVFFQPAHEAFPDASPAAWRRAAAFDPGCHGPHGEWRLVFRCFAIRSPGGSVVLVDTGIGPEDSPAASWAPVPGRLPGLLEAGGIAPESVEAVVLTHLHTDHVGWAVTGGEPFFPNARYVLQRAEAEAVGSLDPALRSSLLGPLREAGRLELADGRTALTTGITAVPTPGHTPGHQSVLASSRGEEAVFTGDALVHAVQITDPGTAYAHESDPGLARRTRTALLDDAAARGAILATPHLGEAFVPAVPARTRPSQRP